MISIGIMPALTDVLNVPLGCSFTGERAFATYRRVVPPPLTSRCRLQWVRISIGRIYDSFTLPLPCSNLARRCLRAKTSSKPGKPAERKTFGTRRQRLRLSRGCIRART